jgi:hypothetical protein
LAVDPVLKALEKEGHVSSFSAFLECEGEFMAWEKETKSLLTREGIKKDLLGEMRASIISIVAFCGCMAFFWLIITFIAYRGLVGRLISTAVFFGLSAVVVAGFLKGYLVVARDRFTIVEDEFLYATEETVRRGKHYVLERVMYFEHYGRYVVSEVDGSAFDYSNTGDRFYLVVSDSKKKCSPMRIYNMRLYQLRD